MKKNKKTVVFAFVIATFTSAAAFAIDNCSGLELCNWWPSYPMCQNQCHVQ